MLFLGKSKVPYTNNVGNKQKPLRQLVERLGKYIWLNNKVEWQWFHLERLILFLQSICMQSSKYWSGFRKRELRIFLGY